MARPLKFDPALGEQLTALAAGGKSRREVAGAGRISLRTLQSWLARGNAGEAGFGPWAKAFRAAERTYQRDRRWAAYDQETDAAKLRWKAFRGARSHWWLARLGPVEFWRRRSLWLAANEHWGAAMQAEIELSDALRARG